MSCPNDQEPCYFADECTNRRKLSAASPNERDFLLLLSTLVAASGGLLFGLDTAVISGTTAALTRVFHLSPGQLGFTVSSALLGTLAGTFLAGYGAERYGRKRCLIVSALAFLLSAIGCALSVSWVALILFRVVGGLGIGAASVLAPMYIAEIAPADRRGVLVIMFQLNIVIGILLAYISNYIIGLQSLGASEWRWELGVTSIPAGIFLALLLAVPESPRWLAKRKRREDALRVLRLVGECDPEMQLARMEAQWNEEAAGGSRSKLFRRVHARAIFLGLAMGIFCQLTGINAVLYFLNDIFAGAGLSSVSGSLRGVAIGSTNLVFTVFAMLFIDRFGRKFLLIVGSIAMASMLVPIAILFQVGSHPGLLLWLLIGYCATFSFSEGAVIWVYISELFPLDIREKGQALGSAGHWITNTVISGLFPVALTLSRSLPFYFFAAMMVLQLFLVIFLFPETKGRSLESGATVVATS